MLKSEALPESSTGDQSTTLLRQRAFGSHERGELSLAELLYREILGRYPDDLEVTRALGILAMQTRDPRHQKAASTLPDTGVCDDAQSACAAADGALAASQRALEATENAERIWAATAGGDSIMRATAS